MASEFTLRRSSTYDGCSQNEIESDDDTSKYTIAQLPSAFSDLQKTTKHSYRLRSSTNAPHV